ncbi:nuclear transport factor 2 family protein [Aquimarina gracilis]
MSKDNSRYKNEVKTTILEFFEGFHAGDTSKINKTIDVNMTLQTVVKTKDGTIKIVKTDTQKFLDAIHNRPVEQRWDERLLLFKIEADSSIANVWTSYEFYLNDKFSHCGVNVFQLYNDGTSWRILALTDTRTREGCK